jgi:hypothetical protein
VKREDAPIARLYWLFSGDEYYPGGGMKDFKGDFSSIAAAKEAFKEGDWAQVIDYTTKEIVERYGDYQEVDGDIWILHRACWSSEAKEVLQEMQKIERTKEEKRLKCAEEGHLWSEWKHHSFSTIGAYSSRQCHRCKTYDKDRKGLF